MMKEDYHVCNSGVLWKAIYFRKTEGKKQTLLCVTQRKVKIRCLIIPNDERVHAWR